MERLIVYLVKANAFNCSDLFRSKGKASYLLYNLSNLGNRSSHIDYFYLETVFFAFGQYSRE